MEMPVLPAMITLSERIILEASAAIFFETVQELNKKKYEQIKV